jgi:hypothetical protein
MTFKTGITAVYKNLYAVLCSKMTDVLFEWLTCRRAALIREEAIDDIRKLQAFFDECKSNNP